MLGAVTSSLQNWKFGWSLLNSVQLSSKAGCAAQSAPWVRPHCSSACNCESHSLGRISLGPMSTSMACDEGSPASDRQLKLLLPNDAMQSKNDLASTGHSGTSRPSSRTPQRIEQLGSPQYFCKFVQARRHGVAVLPGEEPPVCAWPPELELPPIPLTVEEFDSPPQCSAVNPKIPRLSS